MPRADFDGEAVEACESPLPLVADVPLQPLPDELLNLWLDLQMFDSQPLTRTLSGLALEYRIVQLYSRDPGQREATLTFDVGQGTQDLG